MGAGKDARGAGVGLAMQAYLKSGDADARRICEWAQARATSSRCALVKPYWDFHVIHSEQMGWPSSVWPVKRNRCVL